MPYKPPICPAYAQSQCLTLSPIPEAKSKANSPILSCKSSLFSGFEWSSASALTPLMSQGCEHVSSASPSCATSPAILERMEQLNLQHQQVASGNIPGISSILAQPTPTSEAIVNVNLGSGLGFSFKTEGGTPFNTPARPLAPKPIVTYLDPAAIQMKLLSLGVPPLTPPYDEDVDTKDEEVEDNTPLQLWLQYRIEESKRREEYEKESAEALMSASPLSLAKEPALPSLTDEISFPVEVGALTGQDDDDTGGEDDNNENDNEDIIIVTQGKRISVQDSCAIATLKRRSRLMGLHKEAANSDEGLPSDIEVDEFGMKIDGEDKDVEVNGAEVAMNEDRSSPKYSIFSPTSRLPARRSVSFAKPEVTQVKTFSSSPLAPKSHKRKASATSLFTISPAESNTRPMVVRSTRSLSTGAISTTSTKSSSDSNNAGPTAHLIGRHKRARRSSSIISSLAFTSNSLAPIFSSAFLKNSNLEKTTTAMSNDGDISIASLKNAMGTLEKTNEFGIINSEGKENESKKISIDTINPSSHTLPKKRSFGISMPLSFRGRGQ